MNKHRELLAQSIGVAMIVAAIVPLASLNLVQTRGWKITGTLLGGPTAERRWTQGWPLVFMDVKMTDRENAFGGVGSNALPARWPSWNWIREYAESMGRSRSFRLVGVVFDCVFAIWMVVIIRRLAGRLVIRQWPYFLVAATVLSFGVRGLTGLLHLRTPPLDSYQSLCVRMMEFAIALAAIETMLWMRNWFASRYRIVAISEQKDSGGTTVPQGSDKPSVS